MGLVKRLWLSAWHSLHATGRITWDAMFHFFNDNSLIIAGYIAYMTLFALFPFLIFLTTLGGVLGQSEAATRVVEYALEALPPEVASTLAPTIKDIIEQPRTGLMTISIVVALWVASSGLEALRAALNEAYNAEQYPAIWRARLQSLFLTVVFAIGILLTMVAIVAGPFIWSMVEWLLIIPSFYGWLYSLSRYFFGVIVLYGIVVTLYFVLPNRSLRRREVFPGAAVAVDRYGEPFLVLSEPPCQLQPDLRQSGRDRGDPSVLLCERLHLHLRGRDQCRRPAASRRRPRRHVGGEGREGLRCPGERSPARLGWSLSWRAQPPVETMPMTDAAPLMAGKKGLIMGIANERSLAWGMARAVAAQGAELAVTYQGEALGKRVRPLAEQLQAPLILPADVTDAASLDTLFEALAARWGRLDFLVHAIAFSDRDELKGKYVDTSADNFRRTLMISCYSFTDLCRRAAPLMSGGGSLVTLTYYGAERVMPHYNVMGVAKAALEASVRYLAVDLGGDGIRVNAISAGPVRALAASGIGDFRYILKWNEYNAPLKRNTTLGDVGGAAVYLLSDLGAGTTGEVLHVDSGYHVVGMKAVDAPDISVVVREAEASG
jgi:enoyl-[acyl-carrier protein] reductase I